MTNWEDVYGGFQGVYPPGCNEAAALKCEYDFLLCKLFTGPANDPTTLCNCARTFYGSCLRLAGCETAREVGALTNHEIYLKTCVDFIIANNCPDPLICSMNCASDTQIETNIMKIIPFNNYGQYYLRVKTCLAKVHPQVYARYSNIQQVTCKQVSDFVACSRWIPPKTYIPVALPINATYVEIDSCEVSTNSEGNSTYQCFSSSPDPVRIYGNKYLFPNTFDVAQSNISICSSNADCLGSFCDFQVHPAICSPKTIKQALGTGNDYLTVV
eukprot:gene7507-10229_t